MAVFMDQIQRDFLLADNFVGENTAFHIVLRDYEHLSRFRIWLVGQLEEIPNIEDRDQLTPHILDPQHKGRGARNSGYISKRVDFTNIINLCAVSFIS